MDTFTLQDLLATGCAHDSPTVIKYINIKGQSELIENVKNGNLDIVKLLIKNNVKFDHVAIGYAYEKDNLEIVKLLMDNGGTVNKGEMLSRSINKGYLSLVEYLLQDGNIVLTGNNLVEACGKNGQLEIVKYLLDKKEFGQGDINWALRYAAENGHLEIVKLLVSKGGDIKNERNYTLTWACNNGHIEVAKYLIENGSDVKANNNIALRFAAEEGHLEIIKLLITNGADITDGILANTCRNGKLEVVRLLIANGADIKQSYALISAIGSNNIEIVKLLVQNGAVINNDIIISASTIIANYLREFKISKYFGIESNVKLEVKLPELEEILHDNTYYYVYKCTRNGSGWTVSDMPSKIAILASLNCGESKFFSLV